MALTRYTWRTFMWLWGTDTRQRRNLGVLHPIFYFVCDVGVGKGAVLFLGYMISIMKDLNPGVVIVCFFIA